MNIINLSVVSPAMKDLGDRYLWLFYHHQRIFRYQYLQKIKATSQKIAILEMPSTPSY